MQMYPDKWVEETGRVVFLIIALMWARWSGLSSDLRNIIAGSGVTLHRVLDISELYSAEGLQNTKKP